jgi:hypothetical protein
MGQGKGWSSQRIQREIAVPWMVRNLNGDPVQQAVAKFAGDAGGAD